MHIFNIRISFFIFILFFLIKIPQAQVVVQDASYQHLNCIIECFNGANNYSFKTYEVYTKMRYADNPYYKQKGIDLLEGAEKCSRIILTKKGTQHKWQIAVYEYTDSIIINDKYNRIEQLFSNAILKDLEMLYKMNYVFKYNNCLMISNFSDPNTFLKLENLTGYYPLSVNRLNKYLNN